MVHERSPAKVPLQNISANGDCPHQKRELSPDSDTDISAIIQGWNLVKPSVRPNVQAPESSSKAGPAARAQLAGHPPRMMSSLKQKADVFIHQRTRPEHHLDTRVSGPKIPTYRDRKPPPMPVFSSDGPAKKSANYADEVFYTDPNKASEDLKALLEGGMDDDDDGDDDDDDDDDDNNNNNGDSNGGAVQGASQAELKGVDGEKKKTTSRMTTTKASKFSKDGSVDGLKVKLLPHQVEGVQWMHGRELGPVKRGRVPKGGLLADDMGLGKTLQTISLILTHQKPQEGDAAWKKTYAGVEKTTLVVAPLALIRQWEGELREKVARCRGIKVLVHHGPQRTKRFKDLALYDVVITTYQILVSDFGASSDKEDGVKAGCFGLHWWRIILDEAHTIKNRNAKATKASCALRSEFRWCLTGTPLQNSLDELQSLINFLRIKPYDDLKEWRDQIEKPLKNGKGHVAIRRLHSILRCFMKRRTKDILKEEGALNPGGKAAVEGEGEGSASGLKVTERNVVTVAVELSPAERNFYDRLEDRADRRMEAMMREKVSYANAFTLLLRLRQACNHPKLVEGKLEKDKEALGGVSSQRSQDTDVNDVADMLSGMGISTKNCSVCGRVMGALDVDLGRDMCSDCHGDLAYFDDHEGSGRKKAKKPKKKSKAKKLSEKVVASEPIKAKRRVRNRKAVVDSDDDESDGGEGKNPQDEEGETSENAETEGTWLVPENERGDACLGKAGGEEDENAEGGGEWIGPEDSAEEADDDDDGDLSSFVVDDEAAKRIPSDRAAGEGAHDEDDSLLSVSALSRQMASQTLQDDADSDTESTGGKDSDSETAGSGIEESEPSSDDDAAPRRGSGGAPPILASAKIRELIRILRDGVAEHKFIVFSEFTSMLDLAEPFIRKEGIRFVRYDGSMRNEDRERSLCKLRGDDDTRVLLCSLKCGSLGLNLTAATRAVILEPFWNPFVEEQAIDRVHRLTQTVDVTVYKLTVSRTVEERILALQDRKRELANQAIDGSSKKATIKLGLNEIVDLFKPGAVERGADEEDTATDEAKAWRGVGRVAIGGKRHVAGGSSRRPESAIYGRRW